MLTATAVIAVSGAAAVTTTALANTTHRHHHASHHRYVGRIDQTVQNRDGSVRVIGWVFDAKHRSKRVWGCLDVNGSCVRKIRAHLPSPRYDRWHHLRGGHRFRITLAPRRPGVHVTLRALANDHWLSASTVETPGDRVVQVARRYVGGRYTWGGSSPRTGFDCSGYAMYSYRVAGVAHLPHNSNAQRFAPGMHTISRSTALPGDLIFYFSGSSAYHVAIYAGHGMQYSAADPRDGIRYQKIWAHNIAFGTDWH